MSEKRFYISCIPASRQIRIVDSVTAFVVVVDVYDDKIQYLVDLLNVLSKGNEQLRERVKELEKLISDVETSEGVSIENLIDEEMI